MPLIIEGGRIPERWAEKGNSRRVIPIDSYARRDEWVSLALINNMPDAALEDTELQFFELLDIASGDVPVIIKLCSLPGIPRTDRGQRHLNSFYFGIDDLWNGRFDGVIMTGTEPKRPDLRDEPYWPVLAQVLDWAERNTASTVLSCLAAHAGVLHSDGISRHPLSDKQFGVFEFTKTAIHPLTAGGEERVRFPHSRWNEVRADELTASGYQVLTQSPDGGVDSFVKIKKRSLFVHFQGHPEYGAQTLLKEYRRDIKRFLRSERETYPTMPRGFFDAGATSLLATFREVVESDRREELMQGFPEAALVGNLQKSWQSSAASIYGNWLHYVISKRLDVSKSIAAAIPGDVRSSQESAERKPSVLW
jgi:homoserine O-succinyltransferase